VNQQISRVESQSNENQTETAIYSGEFGQLLNRIRIMQEQRRQSGRDIEQWEDQELESQQHEIASTDPEGVI
jgi:hypothetical protein